jgi:hypothetical protein
MLVASQREGRGSGSALGVLLPPFHIHRPLPSYCDVAQARRYFASSISDVSTSEMSVNFYQTTRRNIPEDSNLHTHLISIAKIRRLWYLRINLSLVLNDVPRHADIWGRGGITLRILNFGTNGGYLLASRLGRFAPEEGNPVATR